MTLAATVSGGAPGAGARHHLGLTHSDGQIELRRCAPPRVRMRQRDGPDGFGITESGLYLGPGARGLGPVANDKGPNVLGLGA